MTDQTGRPDDETRPDGTTPEAEQPQGRDDAAPESVLTGFSWDDPSGAAPRRPEDEAQAPTTDGDRAATDQATSGAQPHGSTADQAPSYDAPPSYGTPAEAPAQYPPAAPYPPAGDAYGQPASPPPAQGDPYGQAPSPQPGEPYGQPGYGQPAYGQPGYGQAPAPYPTQSGGYGPSAEYTSTPQPYAYGPPPMSPESEKARSSAVLWTILNGVSIVACGNLLAIAGVICAALAIGKARDDVQASRTLTKWSWILFAIGFALGALLVLAYILFFVGMLGTAGMSGEF